MVNETDDEHEVLVPVDDPVDQVIAQRRPHTTRPLDDSERAVIAHMLDLGKSQNAIAKALGRHPETIGKAVKRLQQTGLVEGRLNEYIDLHLDGARVAATRGNTRPAEFMLERFGVVPTLHKGGDMTSKGDKDISVAVVLGVPGMASTGPGTELPVLDVPASVSKD